MTEPSSADLKTEIKQAIVRSLRLPIAPESIDDGISLFETRACEGYNELEGGSCPYVLTGFCDELADNASQCAFSDDAAKSCKQADVAADPLSARSAWANPITTFRAVQK